MHLKTLKAHFEEMEETDYLELHKRFSPFFHTLCLVWTHSHHYQQPARLVVLLQEVANLLIELVYLFVCAVQFMSVASISFVYAYSTLSLTAYVFMFMHVVLLQFAFSP